MKIQGEHWTITIQAITSLEKIFEQDESCKCSKYIQMYTTHKSQSGQSSPSHFLRPTVFLMYTGWLQTNGNLREQNCAKRQM